LIGHVFLPIKIVEQSPLLTRRINQTHPKEGAGKSSQFWEMSPLFWINRSTFVSMWGPSTPASRWLRHRFRRRRIGRLPNLAPRISNLNKCRALSGMPAILRGVRQAELPDDYRILARGDEVIEQQRRLPPLATSGDGHI
jgi:hypothetical protein